MKFFIALLCMTSLYLGAADLTAAQILEKSIQYHDPNGEWTNLNTTFILEETRPSGEIRKFEVAFNLANQSFRYEKKDDQNHIIKTLEGETCGAWFNGSTQFSKEIEEKHRLSCDRIKWFRNYYLYLYGLPMKLTDLVWVV